MWGEAGHAWGEPVPTHIQLGVGGRRCTGVWTEGRWQPCTTGLPPRGRSCAPCSAADPGRACLICDGFRCPEVRPPRCSGEHRLYLATFDGRTVKVGTTGPGREQARLVEQGPLLACHIARGTGPRIRQMERLLSSRTPCVEAVRGSQKVRALSAGLDPARARPVMDEASRAARAVLTPDYRAEWHPPAWVEAPPLAARSRPAAAGRTALEVKQGQLLCGQVVGAVGPVLLLDDDGARFLLDLGALVGRELHSEPTERFRRSSVQLGLFA